MRPLLWDDGNQSNNKQWLYFKNIWNTNISFKQTYQLFTELSFQKCEKIVFPYHPDYVSQPPWIMLRPLVFLPSVTISTRRRSVARSVAGSQPHLLRPTALFAAHALQFAKLFDDSVLTPTTAGAGAGAAGNAGTGKSGV